MAYVIDYDILNKKQRHNLKKHYAFRPKKTRYCTNPPTLNVFQKFKEDDYHELHVPLYNYREWMESENKPFAFPYKSEEYPSTHMKFTYPLLTKETDPMKRGRDQDVLVEQALSTLQKYNSVFIAAFTGFGKTSTAIYMMCTLGKKVALLCSNNTLKEQWKEEIIKFTGGSAKVQIVTGKNRLDPDADVYIMGVMKSAKIHPDELINIGLVIIDEAHICAEKAFTDSILRFRPLYLIGLSATPDRQDGLDGLLKYYFGDPSNYIVRTEVKKFTVFKYKTKYCPEVSYMYVKGEEVINWSKLISDLAAMEARWKEIANIAVSHSEDKIMILCDRQEMARCIYHYLLELGESAELLIGSKKTWDKSKRILVAGVKKGGTALNDPSLSLLIIAADAKDVRQMEGRIRKIDNVVYVIVDNHSAFENHWSLQTKWFTQRGADIYHVKSIEETHHILISGGVIPHNKRTKVRQSKSSQKRKAMTITDYIAQNPDLLNPVESSKPSDDVQKPCSIADYLAQNPELLNPIKSQ